MTRAELSGVLSRHAKYLAGAVNGQYADLRDADLVGADLAGANLRAANLGAANLRFANLQGADLRDANLNGAILRGANVYGANLRGANLRGVRFTGANLRYAELADIREDLIAILAAAPREARGVLKALRAGRVDGSTYVGPCCCLIGTIAKLRGVAHGDLTGVAPNSKRPAERWFLAIRRGDVPETSEVAAITAEWVDGWISGRGDARA